MMYVFTIELWALWKNHLAVPQHSGICVRHYASSGGQRDGCHLVWSQVSVADIWDTPMKTAVTWLQSARLYEVLESWDVHLFGPLKKHLGGHRFQTVAELQEAVLQWSCSQNPQFHAESKHHSLITRHEKCMNFCGDYVEKYVTVQFSLEKCYSE